MIEPGFNPKYLVTLDEIYHSHWTGRKKRRIGFLKEAVHHFWPEGHPSRLIQVTGTNGKGSVSHCLHHALRFAGATGSWTGPHVFDYAERFHINGQKPSPDEVSAVYREVLEPYQLHFMAQHPGDSLSFAEQGILLALHLFQRHKVVWGIMEVGAGGRYTPLMALPMVACVLTNVGNDHPKSLGSQLWQRAMDKAGIARPGVPFFTTARDDALYYVEETARSEGAEFMSIGDEAIEKVAVLKPGLPAFKYWNMALACAVIQHFHPQQTLSHLLDAMNVRLPGRFASPAPNVIVDVAHNPDKMARFAEELANNYPNRKFRFIIGLTRNRDVKAVFQPILPLASHLVVTDASYAGRDPKELAGILGEEFPEVEVISNPQIAYETEKERAGAEDIIVLTGSAYMIDQAFNPNPYIKHLNATYGWRGGPENGPI